MRPLPLLAAALALRGLALVGGAPLEQPHWPDAFLCAVAIIAWWRARPVDDAPLRARPLAVHAAAGAAAAVAAQSFLGIGYALDWLHFTGGALKFDEEAWRRLALALVSLAAAATFGEQLLVRGVLLHDWLGRMRAGRALLLGAAATVLLDAPVTLAAGIPTPLAALRLATAAAWGWSLSALYAATRSVAACGAADALYRFVAYYGACDVELPCRPVGYWVTSLEIVRALAVVCALAPGLASLLWMRRCPTRPRPSRTCSSPCPPGRSRSSTPRRS